MRERLSALKAAALAAFLCVSAALCAHGQIYHIYRPVPVIYETAPQPDNIPPGWEVDAGAVFSAGNIQDGEGGILSRNMVGAQVRLLKRISERFWAGAEGRWLTAADRQTEFLEEMNKYCVSAVIKYHLTPQTQPALYVLAGGGMVFNRASFPLAFENMNGSGAVWTAGVGTEFNLGRRWKVAGELRISYEPSPWRSFAMEAASSVRREAGATVSFVF